MGGIQGDTIKDFQIFVTDLALKFRWKTQYFSYSQYQKHCHGMFSHFCSDVYVLRGVTDGVVTVIVALVCCFETD